MDIDTITIDKDIYEVYEWVKEHNIVELGLNFFSVQYMYLASFCKKKCKISIGYELCNRKKMAINKFAYWLIINVMLGSKNAIL